MAREDLIAALRNAVDRKEPLNIAKLSLIAAGYNEEEVEEAAQEVEMNPELMQKAPAAFSLALSPGKMLQKAPSPKPQKSGSKVWMKWLIPLFIVVMVLLLGTIIYMYIIKKPTLPF